MPKYEVSYRLDGNEGMIIIDATDHAEAIHAMSHMSKSILERFIQCEKLPPLMIRYANLVASDTEADFITIPRLQEGGSLQ